MFKTKRFLFKFTIIVTNAHYQLTIVEHGYLLLKTQSQLHVPSDIKSCLSSTPCHRHNLECFLTLYIPNYSYGKFFLHICNDINLISHK